MVVEDSTSGPDEPVGGGDALLTLPDELRSAFKDPLGPLYTDAEELLAAAGEPLVTVGDIVTYHFEAIGHQPDVAIVDGRTERRAVDEHVRDTVETRPNPVTVRNPPATLTVDLLTALVDALRNGEKDTIVVEGEEDLAAVPAVLAAPEGATIVYGQPGEGMVAVEVTPARKREFRELLDRMEGDRDRATEIMS